MSSKNKKLQKQAVIKQRGKFVREIAEKHGWMFASGDEKTYKLSFVDKLGIYRLDIYLSTLTIGLLPIDTGKEMVWLKKLDHNKVNDVFEHPMQYELS